MLSELLAKVAYTALISGSLTTLCFLFLTYAIPSFKIKNNATRFLLTLGYFFLSVIVNCIIAPVTIFINMLPWVGTMINMFGGFTLTLFMSVFVLNMAKNIKNVQIGDFGNSNATTYTTSTLLGAANATAYLALPFLI